MKTAVDPLRNVARTKGEPTPRLEASVGAARSLIALRVILDAAVERIGGPNLPRIRPNHQSIPLQGVELDPTIQGDAVEDERQAPSGDRVGLVEKTEMRVRAFRGAGGSSEGVPSRRTR